MLRPEQVEDYAQRCAAAFDDLELGILLDIARRIANANYMTEGAQWQAERAQALGASRKHLAARMEQLMADAAPQVAAIFAQAMLEAEEQDNRFYRAAGQPEPEGIGTSAVAQQLAQSGYRRTMNTLYNLTQTRALMNNHNLPVAVQEQLGRLLDQGHLSVASGAFSYDQVVRQGIKELSAKGLDAITYPSGHTDTLETVVLRAMRTGINQTAMDISQHNAESMDVDVMELTAHGGARTGDGKADFTNHSWWQGKLVSLSGQPGYLTLDDIGYGDVRGFAGANCRHNWHPFWPGISKPAYTQEMLDEYNRPKFPYNGQLLTEEQTDRRQRALERQIRRWKREYVLARETGQADLQSAAAGRLAAARGRLADFLQQTGRHKQQLRETVPGFGRSEASSAAWVARQADAVAAQNQFRRTHNTGIFAEFEETMTLKHVRSVMKDMGLDLGDAKVSIIRDEELAQRKEFMGYTLPDASGIQLYPAAFTNREQLVKTLGHEFTHLLQARERGIVRTTEELINREREAYGAEAKWWEAYCRNTGRSH